MNNKRRGTLNKAKVLLKQASEVVSGVLDEEQDCLDNMPENLHACEKYEKGEDAINCLDKAVEQIDSAVEFINEASE